jgi:hypothetical protein
MYPDIRDSLFYHLQANHYPPIDPVFIDTAIWAIGKVQDEEYDDTMVMPNGITKTAQEIVEELHLDFYLEDDDDMSPHDWEDYLNV